MAIQYHGVDHTESEQRAAAQHRSTTIPSAVIVVDVIESGLGVVGSNTRRRYVFAQENTQRVACSNPYCSNGGVSLARIVHDALRRNEASSLNMEMCGGRMPVVYDRPPRVKCPNMFRVHIALKST